MKLYAMIATTQSNTGKNFAPIQREYIVFVHEDEDFVKFVSAKMKAKKNLNSRIVAANENDRLELENNISQPPLKQYHGELTDIYANDKTYNNFLSKKEKGII